MPTKSMLGVGDTIVIDIAKFRNGAARISTGADAAVGCDVELHVETLTEQWVRVQMWNPVQATPGFVTSITGTSKYAWADVPAASKVRAYRTDAGAASLVRIDHREG